MSEFKGYIGQEQSFWSRHHDRYRDSILAVGRGNATPAVNEHEYAVARKQFDKMIEADFPGDRGQLAVLDCGFGHGHYARACRDLGFGQYVGIDFASEKRPELGPNFKFQKGNLAVPFDFGRAFDLVICIDVIFHLVNDEHFRVAIANLKRHARNKLYVTSLFVPRVCRPYVKHRPLSEFSDLGELLTQESWRDNSIARFQAAP